MRGGCTLNKRLLRNYCKSVNLSGQARDFSGRGIFMKNTLGASLLDEWDSYQQSLFGPFNIFPLNGYSHFFYRRFHGRSNLEVPKPSFFILPCPRSEERRV